MSEQGRALNRMGWAIALAGAWVLVALAVAGATLQAGSHPRDCLAGYYLSGGWCVQDPQPAGAPKGSSVVLVGITQVGPVGIEPTT